QEKASRVNRWPRGIVLELGHEPGQILPGVHVVPRREPCDQEAKPPCPPDGLLEDRRRAPGHPVEKRAMDTPESDEIVAAVLARPEDEVGLPRNEQGHRVIEEPGG